MLGFLLTLALIVFIIYRIFANRKAKKILLSNGLATIQSLMARSESEGIGILNLYNEFQSIYQDILIKSGFGSQLIRLEANIKYNMQCPECQRLTNVKNSLSYTETETDKELIHGRYTKDGDLDLRYNTEFEYTDYYWFEADCDQCHRHFSFNMHEDKYRRWYALQG